MINFDKSNDLEVANYIIRKHDLFFCEGVFYQHKENYWSPIDEKNIRKMILDILKEKYKQTAVKNIIDIVGVKTGKEDFEINLNDSMNLINCLNGFLNINTMKLIAHSETTKKYFSTNQFQVNYSPGATFNRWLKFIDEIFEKDEDKDAKKSLLQEMMGLCLTTETKHEKAFYLLGNGQNGKSKIISIIEAILGKSNFSSLEYDQLAQQFQTDQLRGKLANVCSDIDPKNKAASGAFKRIVSGETMFADIKNKKGRSFKPYCKLIFAANKLPQTTDTSKGYFRRIMILTFNRSFDGTSKDKELGGKLLAEKDGIFLWMIDGLQRLRNNKKFTEPKSCNDELEKYLENSNSIVSFINEMCGINSQPDYYEGYQDLYDAYCGYCGKAGLRPFKKTEMKQEILDRQFKGKIEFNKTGERGQYFKNIKINLV